jgi:hypothetical protein
MRTTLALFPAKKIVVIARQSPPFIIDIWKLALK